jgi:hypothetical protein
MKDHRKMLEEIGGYENELVSVNAGGVREIIDDLEYVQNEKESLEKENLELRAHINILESDLDIDRANIRALLNAVNRVTSNKSFRNAEKLLEK